MSEKHPKEANGHKTGEFPNHAGGGKDEHNLEIFQNLVGIHFLREGGGVLHPKHRKALGLEKPVSAFNDIFFASKAADERFRNRGLYNHCLAQDQKNRVMYSLANYVTSFLYLLQILIAAAITGLSAYERNASVALTVLGAINAVLAGILAWLNGQGMPVRFRRARDQYRECVKAIEAAERTFAEINFHSWPGDSRPDPFKVRDQLEKLYEDARADQESNYPDTQEGPGKTQMENHKRVLEDQIQQQRMEKDKQVDVVKKVQRQHEKALMEQQEREEAIKLDFDNERERLRLEREQARAELSRILHDPTQMLEAIRSHKESKHKLVNSSAGHSAEGVERAAADKAPADEPAIFTESLSATPRQAETIQMAMSMPATATTPRTEIQESALQKLNRKRREQIDKEEAQESKET